MSAWMGQARTRLSRLPEGAVERARLTVVPRPRPRAPRVPFVILVSLLLLGGVVGLLLFNTHMQQASFRLTAMEAKAQRLHATEQSLRMQVDRLRDPQRVAARAQSLGMVPMVHPAFLRLSDGAVLGEELAASPTDAQRIMPLPARQPSTLTEGAPGSVPVDLPRDATGTTG